MSCLAVAVFATPALAQEGRPPISAIDVYVEMIPTSAGDVPLGTTPPPPRGPNPGNTAGSGPAPLPAAAAATVREQGGRDAPLLERIATDPGLGAPQRVIPADLEQVAQGSGAFTAVTDGHSRAGWLAAALLLITAAVGVAAVRQRTRGATRRPQAP